MQEIDLNYFSQLVDHAIEASEYSTLISLAKDLSVFHDQKVSLLEISNGVHVAQKLWSFKDGEKIKKKYEQLKKINLHFESQNIYLDLIHMRSFFEPQEFSLRKKIVYVVSPTDQVKQPCISEIYVEEALKLVEHKILARIKTTQEALIFYPVLEVLLLLIHPFKDANGRTVRLFLSWYLKTQGFKVAEFLGPRDLYLINGSYFEILMRKAFGEKKFENIIKFNLETYLKYIKIYST